MVVSSRKKTKESIDTLANLIAILMSELSKNKQTDSLANLRKIIFY